MSEIQLKYGCNPNQKNARVFMEDGSRLPVTVWNGNPGYINFLDALNGWQLVLELKEQWNLPAAASFKHVSPAGAAVGYPLTPELLKQYDIFQEILTPLACAYIRARGADRMSSFGDFIALSHICDKATANFIKKEVSDGIIAPGYEPEALEILKKKKKGNYHILQIDASYRPALLERKQIYGITFEQERNQYKAEGIRIEEIVTKNKKIPFEAERDLLISQMILKYTQSNSVCLVKDGQAIGIGAGQQSRIHCTRLAADKADQWFLKQAPQVLELSFRDEITRVEKDNILDQYLSEDYGGVLENKNWEKVFKKKPESFTSQEKKNWIKNLGGVSMGSDAFFPFGDNIQRAEKSGVQYIIQPGGSIRDHQVIETCDNLNMAMVFTGNRLFYH